MIRTDTQTANDNQEDHLVSLTLPVQMKIRSSFSAIDSGIQGVLKDKITPTRERRSTKCIK
jgi:hypothetical protein